MIWVRQKGDIPGRRRRETVPAGNISQGRERMMNYMSMMPVNHIAAMMAEDSGAPELRNPLNSGMKARSLLSRLFGRKNKAEC